MAHTTKSLGIKGFTMSEKNEEKVRVAAIRDKYGAKIVEMVDLEIEFHNCIMEYLYPLNLRRQYEEAAKLFGSNAYLNNIYTYNRMRIDFTPAQTASLKIKGVSGVQRIDMLDEDRSYRYNDDLEGLMGKAKKYAPEGEIGITYTDYLNPYVPEVGCLSDREIFGALPRDYVRKLMKFYIECEALKRSMSALDDKLKRIMSQHKSWLQLCNTSDLFIPWVQTAATWNDGFKVCSDLPVADEFAELDKMLK